MAKETNNHFGRYRVLGTLGGGSSGKLYLTIDPAGEYAALLTFHSHVIADVRMRSALLDGAQVATGLDHGNVATTFESGETEGRTFVTTEYLPGESLSTVLAVLARNSEPLPAAIAATVFRELAAGLAYLHQAPQGGVGAQRLLHRDLRPANVFITFEGAVKMTGAGVSAALVTSADLRASARGGLAYASPEDVQGSAVDARSDLFSLGVMLWEGLTGTRLFGADSPAKTIEAVRTRYVEPPSILQSTVPPGLDEVALRLLGRDPRRRYQTADELVAALDRVLASLGGPVSPRAIGEWMEGLFGRERAELKKQIAKGIAVEAALARLRLLGAVTADEQGRERATAGGRRDSQQVPAVRSSGVRPVVPAPPAPEPQPHAEPPVSPTTQTRLAPLRMHPPEARPHADPSDAPTPAVTVAPPVAPRVTPAGRPSSPAQAVVSGPPVLTTPGTLAASARPRRPHAAIIAGAILGVGGIIAAVILLGGDSGPTEGTNLAVGTLDIQSTPSGARVLLDGDPSGLTTPARVSGLRAGRRIDVQVDKPGYKAARQSAEIGAGATKTVAFQLEEAMGVVQLQGVPAKSTIFVDDQQIEGPGPLSLPLGPHRVRVELAGKLFASTKIDVQKGEQTVPIRPLEDNGQ